MLEAALTRQTIEAEKSFKDLQAQFDALGRDLFELIAHWVKKLKRPLTYDEIIEKYRRWQPKSMYSAETLTRRVRKLAEDGWLHSPVRGSFVPVAKEGEEE